MAIHGVACFAKAKHVFVEYLAEAKLEAHARERVIVQLIYSTMALLFSKSRKKAFYYS
jgi:hypothetical protein